MTKRSTRRTCKGTTADEPRLVRVAKDAASAYDGTCVVYFVQAGGCGPIKIGITSPKRLRRRLWDIQNGCPWPLTLRKLMAGSREFEDELHRALGWAQMHGEWFRPVPDLVRLAGAEAPPPPHDSHLPSVSP